MKNKVEKEKSFNNWRHNSIRLTFPNGNAISTLWGYGTYSDNHDVLDIYRSSDPFKTFMDSDTVEIMILNAPEKLLKKIHKNFDFGGDSVKGYLKIDEWLKVVNMLSK